MKSNSKKRLQKPKTFKAFALLIVLFTSYFVNAQGIDDVPRLVNCYQDIVLSPNSENIVLRSDNNRIVLGRSKPRYVEIKAFNPDGTSFFPWGMFPGFYFGLSDHTFKEYYLPILTNSESDDILVVDLAYIDLKTDESKENQNPLIIDKEIDHIKIRFFFPKEDDSNIYYASEYTTINFRTAKEAIQVNPITDEYGCVSYDNFKTSYKNNLTGFCGGIRFTVESIHEPGTYGDLISKTDELTPGSPLPYNVPFDNYCSETCHPMKLPVGGHIDCGCREFNLKTIVYPCSENKENPNCPPLEINKLIEICCVCDDSNWNTNHN